MEVSVTMVIQKKNYVELDHMLTSENVHKQYQWSTDSTVIRVHTWVQSPVPHGLLSTAKVVQVISILAEPKQLYPWAPC